MNAIFKKENVYVAIIGNNLRDEINLNEVNSFIYDYTTKDDVYLYGGRVHLHYATDETCAHLEVDGIPVQEVCPPKTGFSINSAISLSKATAFLNQIENLGIDSFLENYKSQLQEFKKDLEAQAEKIEREQSMQFDEDKSTFLVSLRRFINELSCIIFCLLINMNAGLDNQFYTDAYNEIINLYF